MFGAGESRRFQVSPRQSVRSPGAHLAFTCEVSKAEKAPTVAEHPCALERLLLWFYVCSSSLANSGVSQSNACQWVSYSAHVLLSWTWILLFFSTLLVSPPFPFYLWHWTPIIETNFFLLFLELESGVVAACSSHSHLGDIIFKRRHLSNMATPPKRASAVAVTTCMVGYHGAWVNGAC